MQSLSMADRVLFSPILPDPPQVPVRYQLMYTGGDHNRQHEAAGKEERVYFHRGVLLHQTQLVEDTVCVGVRFTAQKPWCWPQHEPW